MSVCTNTGCTGCPHCCSEMAAILRDSVAGRTLDLAAKLKAMTARHLRALGGGSPRHPASSLRFSGSVPAPPDLESTIREHRAEPSSTRNERIVEGFGAPSAIGPAPKYDTSTPTAPPPSLGDAIRKTRT